MKFKVQMCDDNGMPIEDFELFTSSSIASWNAMLDEANTLGLELPKQKSQFIKTYFKRGLVLF